MTLVPTPEQLAPIDDQELERLALTWRAQAGRGDRASFGVAHALEVELRQRQRGHDDSVRSALEAGRANEAPVVEPERSWWKFW